MISFTQHRCVSLNVDYPGMVESQFSCSREQQYKNSSARMRMLRNLQLILFEGSYGYQI